MGLLRRRSAQLGRATLFPVRSLSQAKQQRATQAHISRDDLMTMEATDRILRINAVLEMTGLSRSTLYRKIERGVFPKQIKLSERCAGWRQSAVNAWMRNPIFYSAEDHP